MEHREVIGSFDAKVHFSELLRRVEQGEHFDISRNGKIVASLSAPNVQTVEAIDVFDRIRALRSKAAGKVTLEEIIEWKNEGRP